MGQTGPNWTGPNSFTRSPRAVLSNMAKSGRFLARRMTHLSNLGHVSSVFMSVILTVFSTKMLGTPIPAAARPKIKKSLCVSSPMRFLLRLRRFLPRGLWFALHKPRALPPPIPVFGSDPNAKGARTPRKRGVVLRGVLVDSAYFVSSTLERLQPSLHSGS